MLIHYIAFMSPGTLFSETSVEQIKSRDHIFDIPKYAFAYYFFDREEISNKGERLIGVEKNESGMFYPNGKLYTKEQIKKEEGEGTLYRNMVNNNYKYVVKTRMGNWQPFNKKKDILVL